MIQDIAPHKFHNEYRKEAAPFNESPVLCFDERKLLVKISDNKIIYPTFEMLDHPEKTIYAFAIDEAEYFLDNSQSARTLEGFEYLDVFSLTGFATNVDGMILFTGYHLASWYNDNRFCGRCGSKNIHNDYERAMHCPKCDHNSYPRIMPAVIVGVTDGRRLLLTQYREGYGHNALVAGFAEIGETLEETVAREVMEETGLKVKNITYYKSQPWGIANDLLAGFYCEADGSTEIVMDRSELRLAQWKLPAEIELQPNSFSLTNEMMKMFKEHGVFWK
ncbi:MAG: NAD(+) diphosphatase [Lachnospiraceae bacterium]|nr:NAD(+) diphosphatase [Lachnospiraceae bacterium]